MWCGWVGVCDVRVCTSAGALMIEEHSITCIDIVCLTIVDNNPISVKFGRPIRRARIEGCGLSLGDLLHLAKQLASRRL